MENKFNQLPIELREYLAQYLDQCKEIKELQEHVRYLLNKNAQLRRANTRLTLQAIQQIHDIQQLEHILANNLDEETRGVQRELDFETLSDTESNYSDVSTVYDV